MEASESEPKRRVLPHWMTAQGSTPVARKPKKRKVVQPASAARHPAKRTVYCMSEAELVDVALGVLLEGRQQEAAPAPPGLEEADKSELGPTRSASLSPGSRSEDEDTRQDSPSPGRSRLPSGAPGGGESTCDESAEEDDALKYVREIFFS
ncbi:cell cycle regulator of non-homologous end joining [Sorex fumeus]|uniref:cell cycle regulator of non-homologous end joining n=1 Tax=Sorex fumeus TaxID=62283 RepID=UPI0024ACBF72|nr:cell cycle regulator of non-homologous end joining [Sorex fumeus]